MGRRRTLKKLPGDFPYKIEVNDHGTGAAMLLRMRLPQLEPSRRVGNQAFEAIRTAITNGQYPAGHRLRIRELADELGTSVMPVREAIRQLEELGLVEAVPNRSAIVKRFTPAELLNVYAVRRLLELEATALGIARISNQDLEVLREAYEQMKSAVQAADVVAVCVADERFLDTLYQAADNPVLLETINILWQRCRSYKMVGVGSELKRGQPASLLTYQEKLLKAAEDRDVARARELTVASIDDAMNRIRQAIPSR